MKNIKNKYFFIGLFVFYLILFLSPNKPVYFSAFLVAAYFFYQATKNIISSLIYTLILSVFSEIGLAGSLFLLEPHDIYGASGYWISPMSAISFLLLILSLSARLKYINLADKFSLLFFIWITLIYLIYPYSNSFFGFLSIVEVLLMYYLLRLHLTRKDLQPLSTLFISMIFFQTVISLLQIVAQQPLVIPQGLYQTDSTGDLYFTIEEESLFRVNGTFSHPNFLATFILSFAPFLFYLKSGNLLSYIKPFLLIVLIFTFSRIAWLLSIVQLFIWLLIRPLRTERFMKFLKRKNYVSILSYILVILIISPLFFIRLESVPEAFEEFGSVAVRKKTMQEAFAIITNNQLFGIGLNRSLETYVTSPTTDLFSNIKPNSFYKIHNTFLEMASEIGLPGILIFLLFLFFIWRYYKKNNVNELLQKAAWIGLLEFVGMSMFNPFFHAFAFRFFFLFAALVLIA